MRRLALLPFIVASVGLLNSCGKEGAGSDTAESEGPYELTGVSQKGPFAIGSSVSVQALQKNLTPTGEVYLGSTSDDLGNFKISKEIRNRFVEVVIDGYFYDEIAGSLSSGTITLRSVSDISEGPIKVNLLTSLQAQRIKNLVDSGLSFADARAQSKTEVLKALNIPTDSVSEQFDKLDISQSGNGNAALLAVSSVFMQAAHNNATSAANRASEISSLISTFVTDFGGDGAIASTSLKTKLLNGNKSLIMTKVRENLAAKFGDLGASAAIPDFEGFVDSDGDGVINSGGSVPYKGFSISEISSLPVSNNNAQLWGKISNGVFYLFSFGGAINEPNLVKGFNLTSKTWSDVSAPPTFRYRSALVSFNNKLYAFGGQNNGATQASTEAFAYDPGTDSWQTLSSAPIGIGYQGSAFVVNNKIWIITGSFSDNGTSRQTIEVLSYDPSNDTWATHQNLTRSGVYGPSGASAALLNGKIYVIGGSGPPMGRGTGVFYCYDPATNTWANLAPAGRGRYYPMLLVSGSYLYVIGGTGANDDVGNSHLPGAPTPDNRIDIYDVSSNKWSPSVNLPDVSSSDSKAWDSYAGKVYFSSGLGKEDKFYLISP